jgi:DNA polymerase I-like protein with 3'-5' exonuclease and polymerase domains
MLIDARNFDDLAPRIIAEVSNVPLVGFDIEGQDDARHEGLNLLMKVDPISRKKSPGKKLVFDARRTVVTGFSLYPDGGETGYYVNLAHADVGNRVPWAKARTLLDAITGHFVIHNASFELTMMKAALDFDIPKWICTLQMAVSAYGPDEFEVSAFAGAGLGGIKKLIGPAQKVFRIYDSKHPTPEQSELLSQIIAKESFADHSYNGFVSSLAYGYGLKQAVKTWFNYQMATFEEVLGNHAHMGQLTGEEVAAYGADDAIWCMKLYHRLLQFMMETNPAVVETFFTQELPMTQVYSDVWRHGMKVNLSAIDERRTLERAEYAKALRELKVVVSSLLPFAPEPNAALAKHEKWYAAKPNNYRNRICMWAQSPDSADDFEVVTQVAGPVSESWAGAKSSGVNLTYWQAVRVLIYDLIGAKLVIEKGKVQSDAEARGRIQERVTGTAIDVLKGLAALAGIEQRMKLYLTPYMQLTDPETSHMYPVLSSRLASRRMACSSPNGQQLAKRGESTYVRGFYLPDEPEHVILSRDWSSVELVEIGDFSGDPEFAKAFGQIPYEDLHSGAAAAVLAVDVEGLTEEVFKSLKYKTADEVEAVHHRLITNLKGERMPDGALAVKYWRTEVGKVSNFNYWYSGALSTIGDRMGWSSDKMWEATDRYRQRFAVAEAWRLETIKQGQIDGYITLPDGHRRVKFEATQKWLEMMALKFALYQDDGIQNMAREVMRAIRTRSNNQIVNSLIQGSCATLAKRSILRINDRIRKEGWKARFMLPIHDELLYSVHRKEAIEFAKVVNAEMCNHPDIIKTLPLHSTASIGLTFEPFSDRAPIGQIELDEAPAVEWLPKDRWGKSLTDNEREDVLDYLFAAGL